MLQRMRDLSVQAANDTNNKEGRDAMAACPRKGESSPSWGSTTPSTRDTKKLATLATVERSPPFAKRVSRPRSQASTKAS